jgi:RNA polymerase sigma-70 factor, ECF subfamily
VERKLDSEPSGGERESVREFRLLAKEQLPRLYAIATKLVGSEAEDAVQECLLKAFQRHGQLESASAGPAWMVRILVNCCRDRGRRRSRRPREVNFEEVENFSLYRKIAVEDPFPYSDSLHLDFLGTFSADDVREVLLRLPLIYRTPLVLCHMQGFATKEVAQIVDAPLGTVLARLHRGRKLFERELWAYADDCGLLEGAPA